MVKKLRNSSTGPNSKFRVFFLGTQKFLPFNPIYPGCNFCWISQ